VLEGITAGGGNNNPFAGVRGQLQGGRPRGLLFKILKAFDYSRQAKSPTEVTCALLADYGRYYLHYSQKEPIIETIKSVMLLGIRR